MGDEKYRAGVVPSKLAPEHANGIPTASFVDALAVDAATALFDAYGVKVERDGPVASSKIPAVPLVSVIGFSSSALSGSLILALPRAVAERTLPVPGASLADWSCELANQLLGRLKNQLAKHQVIVNMGLPVVMSGTDLTLLTTARELTRHYSLSSELGTVLIRLDMQMSASLRFEMIDGATEASVAEGEQLFF